MPAEDFYDLYIMDQDKNILREDESIDVHTAEEIIRDYPWHDRPKSYAQFWKKNTKFSFSVYFMESSKKFEVGFSEKVSQFKLPLPYVGATYGLFNEMDQVIKSLHLFSNGEFEKLVEFLAKHRSVAAIASDQAMPHAV
jgi:hypothetical protein